MTESKIIFITGASRGLGRACAELLVNAGHHVIALGRTVGALEELSDGIKAQKGSVSLAIVDITHDESIKATCHNVHQRFGLVDLWIHTAIHAAPLTPTHQIDADQLKQAIAVNLLATQSLITNINPLLHRESQAVFFSDARMGNKFNGVYGATKQAQISLVQSWAHETARIGPRVVIHQPQRMATKTTRTFTPGIKESDLSSPRTEAQSLLQKLGMYSNRE